MHNVFYTIPNLTLVFHKNVEMKNMLTCKNANMIHVNRLVMSLDGVQRILGMTILAKSKST